MGEAAEHYARWTEWAHGDLNSRGGGEKKSDVGTTVATLTLLPARLRAMSAAEAEALGRVSRTSERLFAAAPGADPDDDKKPSSTNDDASLPLNPPAGIDWDVDVADGGEREDRAPAEA